MDINLVESIAKYRLIIGFLGEKAQFSWWQSSFFIKGSDAFLSPMFGRTQLLAQANGVTRAATLLHDERIGVGHVYHLFRLPEDMEQSIHQILTRTKSCPECTDTISALDFLRDQVTDLPSLSIGPVLAGEKKDMREMATWQKVLGYYLVAFEQGEKTFPYFKDV